MKKLSEVADKFAAKLTKNAAKDKVSRSKVTKMLDRAKADYAKQKGQLDILEVEDSKRKIQLDNSRRSTNDLRQHIMKMHKTMQCMDLASASDAIFYNDDSKDIGYMIGGKEFHLEIDEQGEMKLIPMRNYRKDRKLSLSPKDENCAEDCADPEHEHSGELTPLNIDVKSADDDEDNSADQDYQLTDDDIEELYQSLKDQ